MSESEAASPKKFWVWLVSLPVTMGLVVWAFNARSRANEAMQQLAEAQSVAAKTGQELAEWQALKTEVDATKSKLGNAQRKLEAALRSFSRKDLHYALREAFATVELDTMILVSDSGGGYRAGYWVWSPEEGHQMRCTLEEENVPADFESILPGEDIVVPLEAKRLYHFVFEGDRDRKAKESVLQVKVDEQALFECRIPFETYSTTHHGGGSEMFPRPRVIPMAWTWDERYRERVEEGVWFPFDKFSIGFQRDRNSKEPVMKIGCRFELGTEKPVYAPTFVRSTLTDAGVRFQEVTDEASEHFGLLEITGFRSSN